MSSSYQVHCLYHGVLSMRKMIKKNKKKTGEKKNGQDRQDQHQGKAIYTRSSF